MATSVKQTYSPRVNTSETRKDGRIAKFTVWQTGVTGSTQRIVVP
ncbi:MAG TPA: hypothetical protein VN039_04625 [Nitrospira sp.]|nr:hypothetical protein [Nitrospira sp.]